MIECVVNDLAFGGAGVARAEGMAIFLEGALPGETVTARITEVKKNFARGEIVAIGKSSPERIAPACPHYSTCGGCNMQHLDAERQAYWKHQQVSQALKRIGGVSAEQSEYRHTADWHYRNKMEFAFEGTATSLNIGLRQKPQGTSKIGSVFTPESCLICSQELLDVLHETVKLCRESAVPSYTPRDGKGYWRHLVLRHTREGLMVHLITADWKRYHTDAEHLGKLLMQAHPRIVSFIHSTRRSKNTLAFGEREQARLGKRTIVETLVRPDGSEVRFELSANAFFQTNTAGAEILFGTVAEFCAELKCEHLLDLYCGAGSIGLFLANKVRKLTGYELSEESVRDAKRNARLNGIQNAEFFSGSLESGINGKLTPDMIVCDPPRSGLHTQVIDDLKKMRAAALVLVSCDPATLARDVSRLSDTYDVRRWTSVDMFPQTHHVETVMLLTLKQD